MKTKVLFLFTITFTLFSCESSNEPLEITNAEIVGTWNLTKQTLEAEYTLTSQGQTQNHMILNANAEDIDATFTFSNKPNELVINGSYKLVTTSTYSGATYNEEETFNTNITPFKPVYWYLNGNNLNFTDDTSQFMSNVFYIEEYSSNHLKLKGEFNHTETISDITEIVTEVIYIELER